MDKFEERAKELKEKLQQMIWHDEDVDPFIDSAGEVLISEALRQVSEEAERRGIEIYDKCFALKNEYFKKITELEQQLAEAKNNALIADQADESQRIVEKLEKERDEARNQKLTDKIIRDFKSALDAGEERAKKELEDADRKGFLRGMEIVDGVDPLEACCKWENCEDIAYAVKKYILEKLKLAEEGK